MYIWHGLTWLFGWPVCHPYYGPTRTGNAYFPTSVHKMDGWKPLDYEKRVFLGHVCKKHLSIRRKRVFLEHVYKKIVLRKSMKKSDFGKRVFLEHVCTKRKSNDKTMHISRDQNKNEPCAKKKSNIMQAKRKEGLYCLCGPRLPDHPALQDSQLGNRSNHLNIMVWFAKCQILTPPEHQNLRNS